MARILLTRRWPASVEAELSARHEVHLNETDVPMSQAALAQAMRDFDVVCPTVSDRIDAAVIGEAGRARVLANYGAGIDHIDLAAARAAGITVTNTPNVLTDATAELAVLLMLMVARRAGEGERELRAGGWAGWRPTHLIGRSMKGRTLGLIGYGRIARETARRAQAALGVELAYHSRRPATDDDLGARYVASAADLVAQVDIVSLHCPGGAETRHLIDAEMLARMKPDAVLINTARGSVVDEAALAAALVERRIGGAGLDVYEREPAVHPALLAAPNVVLLPHLGSATLETRKAMGQQAMLNLEALLEGREPPNRVV
ncbi:2-hydroxyacid dehydrogenase [Rhizorhabdus dicambivorans]|uniref:D-glycerate dehydrogenase n=1 Tax=Rhizorhabdus dicambivorans TaxID=1850238 RepID=A0A2A4FXP5_9SPHN|nr:D-glycerate dehydrogenase [Rhizorhabdus dicambivorans]ATE65869.1 D-glycerate dehydrogenase [Rhizorhabdus dicambivorans]PCE42983.1 D-glycerate dehydrogenase [Rhizorhabdus dicambivorans]